MLRRFSVFTSLTTPRTTNVVVATSSCSSFYRQLSAGSSSTPAAAAADVAEEKQKDESAALTPSMSGASGGGAAAAALSSSATTGELLKQQADERRALMREKRREGTGSVALPRNTKLNDDRLSASAREKVSKITITESGNVIQQSGTWHTRGDVVGVSEAGVPIVHRDPDVPIPEMYCTPLDLTETYFELPDGFDQNRFYLEVARENVPMVTLWAMGLLGYFYSWPAHLGWPALLAGGAVVQRLAARFGSGSVPKAKVFCNEALKGKICLVTGASSGVGLHTAIDLATRGADVICSTRRPVNEFWKEWNAALPRGMSKEERETVSKRVAVSTVDMMEFGSVRSFADFVKERLAMHCKALGRLPEMKKQPNISNKKGSSAKPTEVRTPLGEKKKPAAAAAAAAVKKTAGEVADTNATITGSSQIPQFVKAPPLDLLINNAGLMTPEVDISSLGFESHIAANVLGPVYLTELLLPNIRTAAHIDMMGKNSATAASAAAAAGEGEAEGKSSSKKKEDDPAFPTKGGFGRVVNVTSMAHVAVREPAIVQRELIVRSFDKKTFNFSARYAVSKLLNIYYSDELARRGVRSVCAAPGGVASRFFRKQAPSISPGGYAYYPSLLLLRTPREGANTIVTAALARDEHFVTGGLYTNCAMRKHAKSWLAVNDRERAEVMDWIRGQIPLQSLNE